MIYLQFIVQGTVKRGRRRQREKKVGKPNIRDLANSRPGVGQVPEGSGEQRQMILETNENRDKGYWL